MEYISQLISPLINAEGGGIYLFVSIIVMLVVIFFLYKTYRASISVEARLAEFASLTSSAFAGRLNLIEASAEAYHLNRHALGPLARIIDEYCVITTDGDGIITYCNDRFTALSGTSQKALVGKPGSFEHQIADIHHSWNATRSQLSPDKVWHGELCLSLKSGVRWLDCFAFPLGFITTGENGYIYFGTDITGVKKQNQHLINEVRKKDEAISKMEGMLLNSEKMASLGVISAGIAHEINNPIAFVMANIRQIHNYGTSMRAVIMDLARRIPDDKMEKILNSLAESPITLKHLSEIIDDFPSLMEETFDGIDRVQKIITDLKCFSNERPDNFTEVDISKCIDLSLNLARHETRGKIRISRNHEGGTPALQGSETQLSQVFLNLIVNASQAMPEGGDINIHTLCDQDQCIIRVEDTGLGISEEVQENIFEPFFTTKAVGEGTGLGLAISQDIIRRHGGEISVQSQPGQGTTFTISLPLGKASRSHAA
ncbi:MAG: PAS domain-containing protein [Alcanivoracaceae bacterium]|jgi:two-component system, NtrC family, sensor kinase|nr:PAS domain-containing protein [Alcanivoracaceae bacterium]